MLPAPRIRGTRLRVEFGKRKSTCGFGIPHEREIRKVELS
ncbi:hypothetical protein MCEMIH22_01900 [Candidatus Methylacidiphilaceae bacterium]